MSNVVRIPGDVFGGIELKTEKRTTLFSGADALSNRIDVYQAFIGWTTAWSDIGGRNVFNQIAHGSPGGLNAHNDADAFSLFSNGRITSGDYAYASAQFTRTNSRPIPSWMPATVRAA